MAYTQTPGSTFNISAGGEYDDASTSGTALYQNISVEEAANSSLSATASAASAASALLSEVAAAGYAASINPANLVHLSGTEIITGAKDFVIGPTAPTAAPGTNTTQVSTTAFVQAATSVISGDIALKANIASPTLTGVPAAPTAVAGTNTTQIATTAFTQTAIANLVASAPATLDTLNELAAALGNDPSFATTVTNSLASKAPLASPTLTGVPAAPTAAVNTSTTQIATTAFVNAEISNDAVLKTSVTGAAVVPSGTTAQRDGVPTAGYIRFNSTLNQYEGYNGTAWVTIGATGAVTSMVRLSSANGYGSSSIYIRRFTNVVANQGADITYADSATLGATLTINTSGVYAISYNDQFTAIGVLGVSLSTATPAGLFTTLPQAEVLGTTATPGANTPAAVAGTVYLPAGSIVRAHTNGGATGTLTQACQFVITRVA